MLCKDNTYYADDTPTLMYIIIIFLNAAFILFTALTTEPFSNLTPHNYNPCEYIE